MISELFYSEQFWHFSWSFRDLIYSINPYLSSSFFFFKLYIKELSSYFSFLCAVISSSNMPILALSISFSHRDFVLFDLDLTKEEPFPFCYLSETILLLWILFSLCIESIWTKPLLVFRTCCICLVILLTLNCLRLPFWLFSLVRFISLDIMITNDNNNEYIIVLGTIMEQKCHFSYKFHKTSWLHWELF